jgi:hypothetical protein
MIEGREIKEITVDKPNEELMVVIPLKEYRKLIKQVTKYKSKKLQLEDIIKDQERTSADTYRRWWNDEREKTKELEANLEAAQALISQLKVDIDILKKEPSNE